MIKCTCGGEINISTCYPHPRDTYYQWQCNECGKTDKDWYYTEKEAINAAEQYDKLEKLLCSKCGSSNTLRVRPGYYRNIEDGKPDVIVGERLYCEDCGEVKYIGNDDGPASLFHIYTIDY
jgi:hypothetical protein